jgi:tetratricopeptide (TPR) repeat protein
VLLHRYFHRGAIRSPKELERLNDLLLEEHQVNANRRYPSFQSAKHHWLFQSTYFLMTSQYEESVALFGQLEGLFSKHRELWADAPVYYAYLVDGILTGLRSLGKYDTMRTFIEGLNTVSLNTPGQLLQLNQVALGHELGLLTDAGEFERALALWEAYGKQHPADATVAPSRSGASLYFPAAVVYFGLGRYPATLQLVNRVLNTHRAFLSAARYSLFRLLHLLVHYELGNLDYLDYEVRSVERQLRTRKRLFRSENVLLQFFKQSAKGVRPQNLLPGLHAQLTDLGQDAYEKQLLGAFPFSAWAAAKRQRVPFAQWLRQKAASG